MDLAIGNEHISGIMQSKRTLVLFKNGTFFQKQKYLYLRLEKHSNNQFVPQSNQK